jgi:hypothetical protein
MIELRIGARSAEAAMVGTIFNGHTYGGSHVKHSQYEPGVRMG